MTRYEFCEKMRSYLEKVHPGFPEQDYQTILNVYFEWCELNKIEERKILAQAHFICWLAVVEEKIISEYKKGSPQND